MWNQDFLIENCRVSKHSPTFIVAEAGVNHNGDINLAKQLIDAAAQANVDAVKFQTFIAENVVTSDARTARYQQTMTGETKQIDLIKGFELPLEAFEELAAYASKKKLIFLSTPFDLPSADFLAKLKVPAFKIPSGEIVNPLMLKKVASFHVPIILSTGMANLGEIEEALNIIRSYKENRVILLHCVTSYPAPIDQVNLRVIQTLETAFQTLVGFSDHTLGTTAAISAVSLGAKVIEKHFTIDRELSGPDHKASLEPAELKKLVRVIRDTEAALGTGMKKFMANEYEISKIARRSIVASRDLSAGDILSDNTISLKRPADGLPAKYLPLILNKSLKNAKTKDERILLSDINWN
ncbi:MAG: N-acetylneuraminate synthase [Candidatus Hodarchaeales archaeon]